MSVTQKEMAEKLNVSQSQVARALKGGGRVAEETRLRVLKMASELGYDATSNSAGRALAGKRYGQTPRNGIIAVMFEGFAADTPTATPRAMPFFESVFDGFEDEAQELGLDVCMCRSRAHETPRLIREHKVDGVITLGYRPESVQRVNDLGIPLVMLHDFSTETHNVLPNDYDGARQLTEHLLSLGHRRIAFVNIWNNERWPIRMRRQGYLDTMKEHGIDVPDEWIIGDLLPPETTANSYCLGCGECAACAGWAALKERNGFDGLQGELPFTALICYNDAVAMGVITHARADGFEVPNDLSVVGFDDVSAAYKFTPRITSIDFSRYQLGRETLRLLHQVLQEAEAMKEGGKRPEFRNPTFPVRLVVHDSTQALHDTTAIQTRRSRQAIQSC